MLGSPLLRWYPMAVLRSTAATAGPLPVRAWWAFAADVAAIPGCEALGDVVINQVLFRFADDQTTDAVLRRVVDSGEAWLSGTTVDGRRAIRLSVSNWQTTADDIARALAAFRAASLP
jgi:glutamate/tyrosine decarboxylase-like PLP-dependent enzyme